MASINVIPLVDVRPRLGIWCLVSPSPYAVIVLGGGSVSEEERMRWKELCVQGRS